MTLVLDTGALIAFERGDRQVAALVEAARRRRGRIVTSSGCVAQAWRDGPRPARLARLLNGVNEEPLDQRWSRPTGSLCAAAQSSDVIDAHVVLLAHDNDVVVTSDPADVTDLLMVSGCSARIVPC